MVLTHTWYVFVYESTALHTHSIYISSKRFVCCKDRMSLSLVTFCHVYLGHTQVTVETGFIAYCVLERKRFHQLIFIITMSIFAENLPTKDTGST